MTTTFNAYAAIEAPLHPAQYPGFDLYTGKSEYFPIPQGQIDAENGRYNQLKTDSWLLIIRDFIKT